MRFDYLKKFFTLFFIAYVILLITKIFFLFYLHDTFSSFSIQKNIYAILWGYKFDLAASTIVAFIATLFDFHKKLFSWVGSLLLTGIYFIQMGDILYFNESSRHIGYEITDTFTDANSLFMTAYSQHTLFTILTLIIGVIIFIWSFKWLLAIESIKLNRFYILKKLSLILLTIFFIRGMTQHIPLNPWQSNQIGDSKLATLSLNSVYNIFYVLTNSSKKLQPLKLPNIDKKIIIQSFAKLYNHKNIENNITLPLLNKPNVVFFFLESWSAVNMKSYGFSKVTTPFYDSILKKSIHPKAMMAGGHRTTEGMFSVLTSYQNPLGKSIAKTQLQDFKYSSIIKTLNKRGYQSAFFQGTSKETSGTGSLAQSLGFKRSYGKRDIKERVYEENYWGIQDPDLYNFSLKIIDQIGEPFVIGINGATTHDDKIPKGVKTIKFVKDKEKNAQLNALHFSDKALGDFMNNIEAKYPNTLFLLFADHCGGVKGNSFDNYLIPFAMYHKNLKAKNYNVYLSQRDIAPLIYDTAIGDYHESNISFSGKSLLSDKSFFADYYHNGILGWIENNEIVELNIATNKCQCYEIVNFKNHKITCQNNSIKAVKNKMLSFTKISQELLFKGETEEFKNYRNKK